MSNFHHLRYDFIHIPGTVPNTCKSSRVASLNVKKSVKGCGRNVPYIKRNFLKTMLSKLNLDAVFEEKL